MFRKNTLVNDNGTMRHITNFSYDAPTGNASGRINGRRVDAKIAQNAEPVKAKEALLANFYSAYGNILPRAEAIRTAMHDVRNSHIENLGCGLSRGTCEVDGEQVEIIYTGTVTNEDGKTMNAKPYLGDFRNDARNKKRGKRTAFAFEDDSMVDADFISRLIMEKRLRVEDGIVFVGAERIKITDRTKVDAISELSDAITRYNKEKEERDTIVNAFFEVKIA